jgi:hypothetical protein
MSTPYVKSNLKTVIRGLSLVKVACQGCIWASRRKNGQATEPLAAKAEIFQSLRSFSTLKAKNYPGILRITDQQKTIIEVAIGLLFDPDPYPRTCSPYGAMYGPLPAIPHRSQPND